ncbi:hypothetical protein RJ639_034698 [Escallonia herrerae]|uniref:beta-galactosidase n=1 Tax=Escallonia herrerae TaxID=1293975 RepID=A0AA88WWC9_9ASTE|nr:hypothetical protein RJ639_034698 [Escallonia herrerae]
MKLLVSPQLIISHFFCLCFYLTLSFAANNVTYDRRSLIIDGQRKLLISASIHYPRSVPAMWPKLVNTAKEGGVDVIETYVFWNGHELSPGNVRYYFGGRYDLIKFVKIVQQARLYLILRIGPFVAAEWNFGGVPVWLHYVPGTVFRTDNEPFKVENEYGFYESAYGEGGKAYALWAAKMALSQNIGVPWIMCQQFDAPEPVVAYKLEKFLSTLSIALHCFFCRSIHAIHFTVISSLQALQTRPKFGLKIGLDVIDNTTVGFKSRVYWLASRFRTFGGRSPHRPPEDVAYSVARFFQKGGSVQNYYMYHGGTNFGRTSGGPFITTSYDYDAPIDEYGLARLPKWGHLKELHRAIKLCEHALLNNEPTLVSLGLLQEANIYSDGSGACAAFMANMDDKNDKVVEFRNMSYSLPAWSVSILPDCKRVVFNTAKVGSQTSLVEMVPQDLQPPSTSTTKDLKALQWGVFVEKAGIWGKADFVKNGFVDHINTTKDTTDYLWYTTRLGLLRTT